MERDRVVRGAMLQKKLSKDHIRNTNITTRKSEGGRKVICLPENSDRSPKDMVTIPIILPIAPIPSTPMDLSQGMVKISRARE